MKKLLTAISLILFLGLPGGSLLAHCDGDATPDHIATDHPDDCGQESAKPSDTIEEKRESPPPKKSDTIIERRHRCIPNPLAFGTDVSEYCNAELNTLQTGTGGFDTIDDVIDAIATFLQIIALPIAAAAIIYSGILFFFNQGSEERLNKAKDVFKWTLVGVFLVIGVFVILATIRNFFIG